MAVFAGAPWEPTPSLREGVLTRIGHRGSRRERPQNTTSRAGSAAKLFAMTAGKDRHMLG